MGGALNGNNSYRRVPTVGIDLRQRFPNVIGAATIRTTSVGQYAATLEGWFGVGNFDLNTIFPTSRTSARTISASCDNILASSQMGSEY